MLKVIILGPPGAGKGTQSQFITEAFSIVKISTGDMLRSAVSLGSPLGLAAKVIMDKGELVSDDLIIGLVKDRIAQPDCKNGYLFDGFPRTIAQAQALIDSNIDIDAVIELRVPDEIIINRMSGRRVHPGSGRVYHVETNPPKVDGKDDETGESLVLRDDDRPDTVKQRLAVFHEQTKPLVAFYRNMSQHGNVRFETLDGTLPVAKVNQSIKAVLQACSSGAGV